GLWIRHRERDFSSDKPITNLPIEFGAKIEEPIFLRRLVVLNKKFLALANRALSGPFANINPDDLHLLERLFTDKFVQPIYDAPAKANVIDLDPCRAGFSDSLYDHAHDLHRVAI